MSTPFAILAWSQLESPVNLSCVHEVEDWLDRISANCKPESPTLVTIKAHDSEIVLGLGLPESIVQWTSSSGDPPYLVTVGDVNATNTIDFFFHGFHHTEIPRRNLISTVLARKVVHEFLMTGRRSTHVQWEEV